MLHNNAENYFIVKLFVMPFTLVSLYNCKPVTRQMLLFFNNYSLSVYYIPLDEDTDTYMCLFVCRTPGQQFGL